MTLPTCLAAYTDRQVSALANAGNDQARAELIKRGLAYSRDQHVESRASAVKAAQRAFRMHGWERQ